MHFQIHLSPLIQVQGGRIKVAEAHTAAGIGDAMNLLTLNAAIDIQMHRTAVPVIDIPEGDCAMRIEYFDGDTMTVLRRVVPDAADP